MENLSAYFEYNTFLYEQALKRKNDIPTLFEWDEDIPSFNILEDQILKIKNIWIDHK